MFVEETEPLQSVDNSPTTQPQDWVERFRVTRRPPYGRRRRPDFTQFIDEEPTGDQLVSSGRHRGPQKSSSLEQLINDLFQVTGSAMYDNGQPDLFAADFETSRRSVPLTLVLSSLYSATLLLLFFCVSWWLTYKEIRRYNYIAASLTFSIAHLSSVPLYAVAVSNVIHREQSSCLTRVAKLLVFTMASPFFNVVPLLQAVLRLKDSMRLYKTTAMTEEAARLKETDVVIFINLMWFATISCFPQAVYQASEALKLILRDDPLSNSANTKIFAACVALLLTAYTCVQFSNAKENLDSTFKVSSIKRALEHVAWLLLLPARMLAFAIVLAEAPHLGYLFLVVLLIHAVWDILYKVSCTTTENTFCHFMCAISHSVVSLFFLRGGTKNTQQMWRVIVFLGLQAVENLLFVFIPYWNDGDPPLNVYFGSALGMCVFVHCGLFIGGSLSLITACAIKHPQVQSSV